MRAPKHGFRCLVLRKRKDMLHEDKLPAAYKEAMQSLLGQEYEAYIRTLSRPPFAGLRVNTLKISPEELFSLLQLKLRQVPWADTGFYVEGEQGLSKNPCYYAGLYYLQEPSAMSPAALCEAKPGDRVLDLCGAPGGKSTQIACKIGKEGILVSNDISSSRAKALLKNIEMAGIANAFITCAEAGKLAEVYTSYFDKILVDAPCSGEGMFRKDSAVLQAYLKRGPEYFAPIQKELLHQAAKMLKTGGHILYSTCTYARQEDEEVILDFLEKHPDFTVGALPHYPGFSSSSSLPEAVRLFPHKLDGEGHFVCKLVKKGEGQEKASCTLRKKERLPKQLREFLDLTNVDWDEERFYLHKEYIYYLPDKTLPDKSLHYLRSGLLLGRIQYERFEPSQALAMSLRMQEWKNPISLSLEDERVLRYLKGETISSGDKGQGYRLLCVENYPLGFVKQEGEKLKNKYYKGWRMN